MIAQLGNLPVEPIKGKGMDDYGCLIDYGGGIRRVPVHVSIVGKYIGSKIFALSGVAQTPSVELEDGMDYVPTKKEVIFGHHFTSW